VERLFPSLESVEIWKTTQISWDSLTKAEKTLFTHVLDLDSEGKHIPEALARELVEALGRRILDLYFSLVNEMLLKDNIEKFVYWQRYKAFFNTTMNIIDQIRKENEFYGQIEAKYGEDWPEDVGEPDLSGIGEKDFNRELENVAKDASEKLKDLAPEEEA